MSTRITLALPPLSQLNTPYPSIAYMARALRDAGRECHLRDVGLEVMLELFSKQGLVRIFDAIETEEQLPEPAWRTLALRVQYESVIDAVIRFLQGKDRTLATRILDTPFLPRGPRLSTVDLSRFGDLAVDDAARHLCTLFLEDLADLVTSCIDRGFGLACYQHHLATGPVRFDPIEERLSQTNVLDEILDARVDALIEDTNPEVVGISIPFPGMLLGALRMGRRLKQAGITVVIGGGYINTELREIDEPRIWQYIDAITYDDGEGPFLSLLNHMEGGEDQRHRTRTQTGLHDQSVPHRPFVSAAWYGDLPLDRYLQLIDSENPAHRLWSDGRWNKITLAHGCYWKKCAFCDVELDYISRYEPARISQLVDSMEELIEATGQSGFHAVDEAAPPKVMRDIALEILDRSLSVSWWGNIRFERAFTPDMCRLLAASGLIAVTGGLEVASNRLLDVIDKGITVEQAARTAHAFGEAGVLVHAYLMYGFPSQTEQETVDSMEVVRQMFETGVLTSGFWHRFVLTRHSRVFQDPEQYGVQIPPLPAGPLFATNDIPHIDQVGADPDRFDRGLVHAIRDWMRGDNFERPVHIWFDPPLVPTQEHPRRIEQAISSPTPETGDRLVWLGGSVLDSPNGLLLHHNDGEVTVGGRSDEREWLHEVIEAARPGSEPLYAQDAINSFPGNWERYQRRWQKVRAAGMVQV
ncbi:MAG: B12-binding domain-containing radical SAM protein [Myxococcota bacterium]